MVKSPEAFFADLIKQEMYAGMKAGIPRSFPISLLQYTVKAISSGDCWQRASGNKLATTLGEQYMLPWYV